MSQVIVAIHEHHSALLETLQNYGAELFVENDGSVTLNGNTFISNGLGRGD